MMPTKGCSLLISPVLTAVPAVHSIFDGVNDVVTLPNILSGSYTKEAWVYSYNSAVGNNIVSGSATAFWAPNTQSFKLTAGHSPTFNDVQDPTPLVANTWTHVAVTYDASTGSIKLYKNGSQVGPLGATAPAYTETIQYIGGFSGGFFWNGRIDEVRIWNTVRTGAQILAYKDSILNGDEPGLIGYYRVNNGIGSSDNTGLTTLTDISDKCVANNGTLSGFTLNGPTSNWVNDSTATFKSAVSSIAYPNIAISGNSVCITAGDLTPSSTDFTDFGTYLGPSITRTFTISNTGTALLSGLGVTIGGTNAASFSISQSPAATAAAGGSTTFKITYTPAVTGTSNATITVTNNDPDEAPYVFAISGNSTVLPVELIWFKGEKTNEKAHLSWQTASEHNNKGFELQRSPDGAAGWEKIGFVAASAFPALLNTYNFTDGLPLSGINAYRLKQTDIDGNYSLSQIVVLNFTGKGSLISFYPNPVKNKVTLQFNDNNLLNTYVQLSTATGRILSAIKLVNNRQEIDMTYLPQGIYLLSFNNGAVKRMIKQ